MFYLTNLIKFNFWLKFCIIPSPSSIVERIPCGAPPVPLNGRVTLVGGAEVVMDTTTITTTTSTTTTVSTTSTSEAAESGEGVDSTTDSFQSTITSGDSEFLASGGNNGESGATGGRSGGNNGV